jgi:hypothetical protein
MKEMVIILFSAILVNNFVLVRFLGICPFPRRVEEIRFCSRDEFCSYLRHGVGYYSKLFLFTWDC